MNLIRMPFLNFFLIMGVCFYLLPTRAQEAVPAEEVFQETNTNPAATLSDTLIKASEYNYDPTGLRDPFKPYKIFKNVGPVGGKGGGGGAILEPLQRMDLDKLLVVGILWAVKNPRAVIKDTSGGLHTIQLYSKIGRHNGYVAAIREGEVVVLESFEEDGKMNKQFRILELRKQ